MQRDKVREEIESFQELWKGGTNPSKWGWDRPVERMLVGGVDIEAIYEICIKPYAVPGTRVLDIGTNGGIWLSKMTLADDLIGFDVLSAEHVGFWQNMLSWLSPGEIEKVGFVQVTDFSCSTLEDSSIDLVFSYDVFCHISYSGAAAYLQNLFSKLRPGANGFIMIADDDKIPRDAKGQRRREKCMFKSGFIAWKDFIKDDDGAVSRTPGRWYFYGTDKFCALLEKYGYEVLSRDVAEKAAEISPIIHFRKPQ